MTDARRFWRRFPAEPHEAGPTAFLFSLLQATATTVFVDVGTYFGWYATWAGLTVPAAHIYAYDLCRDNVEATRRVLSTNGVIASGVAQLAILDRRGVVRCSEGRPRIRATARVLPEQACRQHGEFTVRCAPMDDLLTDVPDRGVVKIDVEGTEVAVLRGTARLLSWSSPVVLLELHPTAVRRYATTTEDAVALLDGLGYGLWTISDFRSPGRWHSRRRFPSVAGLGRGAMVVASRTAFDAIEQALDGARGTTWRVRRRIAPG